MSVGENFCSNAPTRSDEFCLGELTVLLLPLADGTKTVSNQKGASGSGGHPRRNTDAFVSRCREDLRVHLRTNSDGQLW
jgi:hypothetical protein